MKNARWNVQSPSLFFNLAFLILNIALFSSCALKPNRGGIPQPVQAAIDAVSEDINEGRYEKIYQEAADEWRQAATLEESNAAFQKLKERLGSVKSRVIHTATEQENTTGTPAGHSFIVSYKSTFEHGDAMETFTFVERQGRWLLARYFVNSDLLK